MGGSVSDRPRVRTVWWVVFYTSVGIVLAVGILLLAEAWLPYPQVKLGIDALAPDGQVESFTLARYLQLRPFAIGFGLGFLIAGGLALAFHRQAQASMVKLLSGAWRTLQRLGRDFLSLVTDLAAYYRDKVFLTALAVITLVGALVRYAFLELPISYDEAYTFVVFAMRPLRFIMSDYHVPNNHIFHTILVRAAYLLFGADLWVVRLPVFIAGILLIPLVYLAGKMFFERYTALLSAALVAGSSILIEFSANARGYMLVSLFGILLLVLAIYLKDQTNLAAWVLFVVFSVLGFYTVPIFLYPFGMVMSWLFVSALAGDVNQPRWSLIRSLIVAGVAVGGLTLLLYLPVFRTSGVGAVTGNRFVSAVDQSAFVESILGRFRNSWLEWTRDLPAFAGALMALGMVISTVFNHKLSRQRVPFLIPAVLWIGAALAIQRVTPWPRVWLFLLPFLLIWTSAGLVGVVRLVGRWARSSSPAALKSIDIAGPLVYASAVVLLAVLISIHVYQVQIPIQNEEHDERAVAAYLQDYLQPGDVVAAAIPVNYPLRYYFVADHIPLDTFFSKTDDPQFRRAIVVVDSGQDQTLTQVMELTRLDEVLKVNETPQLVHQERDTQIYTIDR